MNKVRCPNALLTLAEHPSGTYPAFHRNWPPGFYWDRVPSFRKLAPSNTVTPFPRTSVGTRSWRRRFAERASPAKHVWTSRRRTHTPSIAPCNSHTRSSVLDSNSFSTHWSSDRNSARRSCWNEHHRARQSHLQSSPERTGYFILYDRPTWNFVL
jgi:hypothetical protein